MKLLHHIFFLSMITCAMLTHAMFSSLSSPSTSPDPVDIADTDVSQMTFAELVALKEKREREYEVANQGISLNRSSHPLSRLDAEYLKYLVQKREEYSPASPVSQAIERLLKFHQVAPNVQRPVPQRPN